jgi:hypothetical protein
MWDNGVDKPEELAHIMAVRRVAISHFGEGNLRPGEALSNLRRKFVPVWLFHRYEVIATGKWVGGMDYAYGVAGDGRPAPKPVDAKDQRAALAALLTTLTPEALTVPTPLVNVLSSGVNGRNDAQFDTEVFNNAGSAVFDPLVATDVAAQVTLDTLLAPARLTRIHEQKARDAGQLGLEDVDALAAATVAHTARRWNAASPCARWSAWPAPRATRPRPSTLPPSCTSVWTRPRPRWARRARMAGVRRWRPC